MFVLNLLNLQSSFNIKTSYSFSRQIFNSNGYKMYLPVSGCDVLMLAAACLSVTWHMYSIGGRGRGQGREDQWVQLDRDYPLI